MTTNRLISGVATTLLVAGPAFAQQEQAGEETQQTQQTQVAQQCQEDLQQFGQRIQEEGYWLTGVRDRWGTGRWGGTAGTGYYPGMGVPPTPGTTAGTPATEGTAGTGATQGTTGTAQAVNPPPWGLGIHAPGVQIQTLFRSAQILAVRGDQEGCEAVLSELTQLYDEYVSTLQEAGVEPGEVTGWRQEMIVAAQPVDELGAARISADEVTDTEVRNMQDEHLGEIEDVLISDGQIEHVVISRGGFLGLGEDYTIVPWEELSATPSLNLFLLDVPEEAMEQAPTVSGDVRNLPEEQRAEIAQYWQQGDN